MIIRPVRSDDRAELLRMRLRLWPDSEESEVDGVLEQPVSQGILLVAGDVDGRLSGFAEVGLRKFADGCRSSPVAYLEGIWVDDHARRGGLASALVREGETWARARGLAEFASDCELGHAGSEAFHRAAGFEETQRGIYFRRALNPAPNPADDPEQTLEEIVRKEVERMHKFFETWFSGALLREEFDLHFISRFDSDFVLIPPTGTPLGLEELSSRILDGHGSNPSLSISIRNLMVRCAAGDQILATYEEWQRNPMASPSENVRVATVLLKNRNPLLWLHVHETWLPAVEELSQGG